MRGTLAGFARHLIEAEADLRRAQEAFVVKACKKIQKKAKGFIGHE